MMLCGRSGSRSSMTMGLGGRQMMLLGSGMAGRSVFLFARPTVKVGHTRGMMSGLAGSVMLLLEVSRLGVVSLHFGDRSLMLRT